MEAESKYTYVGLALVILVAALVTGVIWLNRTGARADFNYYTIYFERQPLDGLQLGADVDMRGIKIGRVIGIGVTPKTPSSSNSKCRASSATRYAKTRSAP